MDAGPPAQGRSAARCCCCAQLCLKALPCHLQVGILDVDLCGPSIPRMFRVQDNDVHQCDSGWVPVFVDQDKSISLMSIGFLLEKPDDAVVWRGPKKNGTSCLLLLVATFQCKESSVNSPGGGAGSCWGPGFSGQVVPWRNKAPVLQEWVQITRVGRGHLVLCWQTVLLSFPGPLSLRVPPDPCPTWPTQGAPDETCLFRGVFCPFYFCSFDQTICC